MKPLNEFQNPGIRFVFTDIDDTITDHGKLPARSYQALWDLHIEGIQVVPVTGRPAGWCEMIARLWPVAGVVGENGAFYFRYHDKKMIRHYAVEEKQRAENQKKLQHIKTEVLGSVEGTALASDQFCRLFDLAIDFAEDVPKLSTDKIEKIVNIFKKHGAQAKVSSIHVNGWFGDYNKLTMCEEFVKREFSLNLNDNLKTFAFIGDSPNDEPMFEYFENSFAVANINNYIEFLQKRPKYVTIHEGSKGFCAIIDKFLYH